MKLVETIAGLREELARKRRMDRTIGLVPTMGALHEGHAALADRARAECDVVVLTLFVNPTQFNSQADLAAYPRTMEEDLRTAEEAHVDFVFAPDVGEMYPEPGLTTVSVARLTGGLCGAYRPGHFDGVATVCSKLFAIAQPDKAFFGEKDYQQLAVIRRMVRDLNLPLEVVGVETVREPDGLAMSSRNLRLSEEERRAATAISRGLSAAQAAAAEGETEAPVLLGFARKEIQGEPLLRLEYLEIVDADSLEPVESLQRPARMAAAVWTGDVRLIDNLPLP